MWRVRSSSLSRRVRSCFLMTSDVVLVEREAAGHAGLLVRAHPQPVEVQRRSLVEHERGARAKLSRNSRARARRRRRQYGSVSGRQIDLGAGDVQEAEGIAGRELPAPHPVRRRRTGPRRPPQPGRAPAARRGTDGSKPSAYCSPSRASQARGTRVGQWLPTPTTAAADLARRRRTSAVAICCSTRRARRRSPPVDAPGIGSPGGSFRCSASGSTNAPFFFSR